MANPARQARHFFHFPRLSSSPFLLAFSLLLFAFVSACVLSGDALAADRTDKAHDLWLERARKNTDFVRGKASWYGNGFHRGATASGIPYDMYTFTAAHRTLPFGTVVRVTDQYNGKSVMVCVTDRGPFVKGRIIDMSYAAADRIGLDDKGVSAVNLEVVSDAGGKPLRADEAFFVELDSVAGPERYGPYETFADASAIQEAMRVAHPEADVVLASRDSAAPGAAERAVE